MKHTNKPGPTAWLSLQCYYAEKGLQVTVVEGGPDVDFIAPVADGTSQFGVAWLASLVLARVDGNRLPGLALRRHP